MHRSSSVCKWKQSKTDLNKYTCRFWCERTTGGSIMDSLWTHILCALMNAGFRFTRLDWNRVDYLWCYCDAFISCLDSHSDGTHSLQRIHWWASDVMQIFSKSVLMKKQTHLHLGWYGMSTFSANFHFRVSLRWTSLFVISWLDAVEVNLIFSSVFRMNLSNKNQIFAHNCVYSPVLMGLNTGDRYDAESALWLPEAQVWRQVRDSF